MKLIRILNIAFFVLSMGFIYSCDGIFPSASKPNVPDDHTTNYGGILHKGNREEANPDECNDCHTLDLRGKVTRINGVYTWAPSCYQCHGKLWERNGDKSKVSY